MGYSPMEVGDLEQEIGRAIEKRCTEAPIALGPSPGLGPTRWPVGQGCRTQLWLGDARWHQRRK